MAEIVSHIERFFENFSFQVIHGVDNASMELMLSKIESLENGIYLEIYLNVINIQPQNIS